MTAFDDLKQKFAVLPVEDLGDCIVIPGEHLDLDWILMFLKRAIGLRVLVWTVTRLFWFWLNPW